MSNVVVLSPEELRAIVREAVAEALREVTEPKDQSAEPTDEERAAARKRWARKLGGKR
jgi:predicted RecB family endonuclease